MTINKSLGRMPSVNGDGETTSFDFTFRILDAEQLLVITRDQDGVETVQTDYSVSGVGSDTGGSITFSSAPGATDTIHIILNPKFTQEVPFQAEEYEKAFDRQTQQNIRVNDKVNRALKVSETSEAPIDGLTLKPKPGAMLIWDENNKIDSRLVAELGKVATVQEPLVLENNELRLNSDAPKNKFDATSAPTVNHDTTQGYSVGSEFLDITNKQLWVCFDPTEGEAVWVHHTGKLASLDSVDTDEIEDGAVTLAKLSTDMKNDIAGALRHDEAQVISDGGAQARANIGAAPYFGIMHIQERQPSGTPPSALVNNNWGTRDLNTVLKNEFGGTLGSKRITLPAGTYRVRAISSTASSYDSKLRIFNNSDNVTIDVGLNSYAHGSYGCGANPFIYREFTISSAKQISIQQRQNGTNGGNNAGMGVDNIYCDVLIEKVA